MTTTQTEIETITLDDVAPYVEDNDPNRRTHIINPSDNPHISFGYPNMVAQQVVDIARMNQIEIVALCGHKLIPQHNPEKYDACDACIKRAGEIMKEMGQ